MKLLNTSEAAAELGVSVRRVRQLIDEEKLAAQKVGRDYAIQESALDDVKIHGKAGRPPGKPSTANKATATSVKAGNGASAKKKGKR